MVQVLESNPTFAQQIGRATGGVLGKGAAEVAENLALKQRGIDVSGLSGYARDVAIKEGTKRAMMLQQGQRTLAPAGGEDEAAPPAPGNQSPLPSLRSSSTTATCRSAPHSASKSRQTRGGATAARGILTSL